MINDVRPFKAQHFNPDKISDIGHCLSQPYDVISPEQQDKYYEQHKYNIIRLILGKILPNDNDSENRYTRAKKLINDWRDQNVLHSTSRPSFWVYEQEFSLPDLGTKRVKGFIGAVRLSDYNEKKILPHEKVLKKPVEDRIKLTKTLNTQLEYIWSVYQDSGDIIDNILNKIEENPPIINYLEQPQNVRHKLWRLIDPEKCEQINKTMQKLKIYIADGHHRYQTMLSIRDEMRKKFPDVGPDAPWEFIMMFLVNSEHEGLTIFPTHRLIHNLEVTDWMNTIESFKEFFKIIEFPFTEENREIICQEWLKKLKNNDKKFKIGASFKGVNSYYHFILSDIDSYTKLFSSDFSSIWKLLDVNILKNLILKKVLKISEEQLSLNTNLKYTIDPVDAVRRVADGEMQAAFVLNSPDFNDIIIVSDNDEKMPRKSTFFFPKPVSGLVMWDMNQKSI